MKPFFISHESYQDSMILRLRQYYSGGIFVIVHDNWHLVVKLWMTDLSYITTQLQDCSDPKGRLPRDPASMLRSLLNQWLEKPLMVTGF